MERRKSNKKSLKRLSSLKEKNKLTTSDVLLSLPVPSFEVEDVLLTQLQVSDVLNNCVHGENDSFWSLGVKSNNSPVLRRRQSFLCHRCYYDTTLTPLWHAFYAIDTRSSGQALLGRLMNLTLSLTSVLGEEYHTDVKIQHEFIQYAHVPFSRYKRYVMETTSNRSIDADKLCAVCWEHCKKKYLNNPLVNTSDPVIPQPLYESLYWLFCIFNKLTEPGTYPPAMDYEETELFLRKLLAFLGVPWSTQDEPLFNEDASGDDFEPNAPLQVDFQSFLSIIGDVVGVEVARSPVFSRTVQRLCLTEYQQVAKSGWMMIRKGGSDVWKKRWCVLQGPKLTCYDSILCQVMKEEVVLHNNMHVESLPAISSYKYRFRVVEKEGFTITCEHEFSSSSFNDVNAWINLINVSIRIVETGMTAKTSEACERRLERFNRRESIHDVYKKKQDVLDAQRRLEEAKKKREDIEERLADRARRRKMQMEFLEKMDKIYERLEAIQFQKRLRSKEEREKRLMKLLENYEQCVKLGKIVETPINEERRNSRSLQNLLTEETQLEHEIETLKQNSIILTPSEVHSIAFSLPGRSASLENSAEHSYSSSENISTSSTTDLHLLALPEMAVRI